MNKFEKAAFLPADILIPKGIDMQRWSVVACDQYTSQPDYWKGVEEFVGGFASTLKIVFPEFFLEDGGYDERIKSINQNMDTYLKNDVFETLENSFVYVERTLSNGKTRRGIIGVVDLEAYDYRSNAKSLIRATEETVVERIPPRIKIRIDAPMELPHIMLLIDDDEKTVIEPWSDKKADLQRLYDFELMEGGGHIRGYKIPMDIASPIAEGLNALLEKSDLLFAVGDGNHSLATAKECWELAKKQLTEEDRKSVV